MTNETMITNERLEQLADDNIICKVSWDERVSMARELLALRKAFTGEPDAWMTIHCQPPTQEEPGGGPEYIELHELRPGYGNFDGSPAQGLYRKPESP